MFKAILPIVAGLLCSISVFAQGVALQTDHPNTYTVVRGDTLWGIAERFLQNPWLWPEIWQANPQIENPHLIYPGDVITLVYVDGQPRLQLQRGDRPIVKLSPHARATPLRDAIQPIDLNEIRQYFDKRTVLDKSEIDGLPYVVAMEEHRNVAYEGHRIYVRDLENAEIGDTFSIVAPSIQFVETPDKFPRRRDGLEPETFDWSYEGGRSVSDMVTSFWRGHISKGYWGDIRSLGYEVVQSAVAEVTSLGDPTTLLVISSDFEVREGHLVIPIFTTDYDLEYIPHRPDQVAPNMRVIAVSKTLIGNGPNEVVAINRGSSDGVAHGDVYSVFHEGEETRDRVKYPKDDAKTFFSKSNRADARVKLPDEYAAHVMVFKTYDKVSYALVMRSRRLVRPNNLLKAP
jgi:hypothetical protein